MLPEFPNHFAFPKQCGKRPPMRRACVATVVAALACTIATFDDTPVRAESPVSSEQTATSQRTETTRRTVPAQTAVLRSEPDAPVRARPVDWSGYRGIRRYSPYYYPAYASYRPYYYGHYAYRPWYARPYANFYGYPAYAPPFYATRGWYRGYAPYAGPYAWHGFYPPAVYPPVVVSPQVSWTAPAAAADYAGCIYW